MQNKNEVQEKQYQNKKNNYSQQLDEVDAYISSAGKYLSLPRKDGESVTYQFFQDKSKRKLVTKSFVDPVTKEEKPLIKVEYTALDPYHPEQGEKLLDVTKSLAVQIEANIAKGHCLQEITRHGTGPDTRYTSITA
jgi:hypothetical protein